MNSTPRTLTAHGSRLTAIFLLTFGLSSVAFAQQTQPNRDTLIAHHPFSGLNYKFFSHIDEPLADTVVDSLGDTIIQSYPMDPAGCSFTVATPTKIANCNNCGCCFNLTISPKPGCDQACGVDIYYTHSGVSVDPTCYTGCSQPNGWSLMQKFPNIAELAVNPFGGDQPFFVQQNFILCVDQNYATESSFNPVNFELIVYGCTHTNPAGGQSGSWYMDGSNILATYNGSFDASKICATKKNGVEDGGDILTFFYSLSEGFPNPTHDKETFNYHLYQSGTMEITLVSSTGQELIHVADQQRQPGDYVFGLDLATLPSGSYLAIFNVDGHQITRPIVVAH